jgi:hypothetical protein
VSRCPRPMPVQPKLPGLFDVEPDDEADEREIEEARRRFGPTPEEQRENERSDEE